MLDSFAERAQVPQGDGAQDAPDAWPLALWAWSQYALYPVILFVSWSRLGPGWALGWSLPLAFRLYNLWMTGHDACHNSVFRERRPGANHAIAFLTLDCLLVTQKTWLIVHHKAEGEEKLLAVAREEFKTDWSDPSTASFCQKLVDMPVERRTAVVERERSCLPAAGDCAAFVECNVHNLERKWSAPPTPPATPPTK